MLRILVYLFFLVILGVVALSGYALLGDLSPARAPVEVPITLTPR